MCKTEETVVRNKATASAVHVATYLTDEQMQSSFVPIVKKLGQEEWFTPKTSCCALFPVSFSRSPIETKQELLPLFKTLCSDETPMVRRAAASQLKVFIDIILTK